MAATGPLGLIGIDQCEHRDQFSIGGREFERREGAARDPAHVLAERGARLAVELAAEEMQFDDAIGIGVGNTVDFRPTRACVPSSSVISRARQAASVSSALHLPPGNSQ